MGDASALPHPKPGATLRGAISLKEVIQLRNFVEQFGNHFANHVRGKLR
jgi:hypothetical protein